MAESLGELLKASYVAGATDMRDRLTRHNDYGMVLATARYNRDLGYGLYSATPFWWDELLEPVN